MGQKVFAGNVRAAFVIAGKELREALRDKRSLWSALLYGVWGPLVMAMALFAIARNQGTDGPVAITIAGADRAPGFVEFLAERNVDVVEAAGVEDLAAAEALVKSRKTPVIVQVSAGFEPDLKSVRRGDIDLVFDSTWTDSRRDADRARAWVREYAARIGETRLILRGVSPAVTAPIDLRDRDISTAAGRAGVALATLPMFVLLATFIGGMSVAADVTAGERERGSLESLLVNPVPRLVIVTGKWMATSVVALVTTAVTLFVAHLVLSHPRLQAIDLPISLPLADALMMWLILAPLALAVVALQLWMALQARTFKEAQTQLSLMMFAPMVPGFLIAFGSLQVTGRMAQLPVIGQHLIISDIVRGLAPEPAVLLRLTLATLALAAVALWACARGLSHERSARRLT